MNSFFKILAAKILTVASAAGLVFVLVKMFGLGGGGDGLVKGTTQDEVPPAPVCVRITRVDGDYFMDGQNIGGYGALTNAVAQKAGQVVFDLSELRTQEQTYELVSRMIRQYEDAVQAK